MESGYILIVFLTEADFNKQRPRFITWAFLQKNKYFIALYNRLKRFEKKSRSNLRCKWKVWNEIEIEERLKK